LLSRHPEDHPAAALGQCLRDLERHRLSAVAGRGLHHRRLHPHRRRLAQRPRVLATAAPGVQLEALRRLPHGGAAAGAGGGPEEAFEPRSQDRVGMNTMAGWEVDPLADEARIRERLADFLQARTHRRWDIGAFTRYAVGFSW